MIPFVVKGGVPPEVTGWDVHRRGDVVAVSPEEITPRLGVVVYNANGKGLGLPFNRPLMDKSGLPYDIVCGTFFLAGLGAEDFVSLTEEQIRRYKKLYDNVMVITAVKEPLQGTKTEQKKKRGNAHER